MEPGTLVFAALLVMLGIGMIIGFFIGRIFGRRKAVEMLLTEKNPEAWEWARTLLLEAEKRRQSGRIQEVREPGKK